MREVTELSWKVCGAELLGRCHARVARCEMCGVKSKVRSPRCEGASTTYFTHHIAHIRPYFLSFTLHLTFHTVHLALRSLHFTKQSHNPYVFCSCLRVWWQVVGVSRSVWGAKLERGSGISENVCVALFVRCLVWGVRNEWGLSTREMSGVKWVALLFEVWAATHEVWPESGRLWFGVWIQVSSSVPPIWSGHSITLICSFYGLVYLELYTVIILTHPVHQTWSNCITSIQKKEYALEVECTFRNDSRRSETWKWTSIMGGL